MKEIVTYCRICEAACGLRGEIDDRGELTRLTPDKAHPSSKGYVCAKGLRFPTVAAHPDRVTRPLLRGPDGQLRPVSWPEALAFVRERLGPLLDRYGPHAVALYGGNPLAFNAAATMTFFAFARALGTRNVYVAGSQDCHNKFAASELMHGSPFIHPLADLAHADLAVFLGTNPALSQASFLHLAEGARAIDALIARGGATLFIDPRETESAKRWGGHVPVRPGTDVYLLLALLGLCANDEAARDPRFEGLDHLLDLARRWTPRRVGPLVGLAPEAIRDLADRILAAGRVTFHLSVGVNQGPFGTLAYVVMQALAAVTGNLDRAGGLLFHPLAVRMARLGRRTSLGTRSFRSRIGGFRSITETLPGAILADEILTPGDERVRALIVVAGDPARSIPGAARLEEAFAALDALIVIDLFENQSSRHADLVLPATSWLERGDVALTTAILQHTPLLQHTQPVLPPRGEARNEADILADLALAVDRPLFGSRLLTRALRRLPWRPALRALGALWARVRRAGRYGLPVPVPRAGRYLGRGPLTPGRRVRFWHPDLLAEPARLEAHAARLALGGRFTLIGRRRRIGHNGWLHGGTRGGRCEARAWLCPADLEALGLEAGDPVRVRSEAGEIVLPAAADEGLSPGTVSVPHGLREANVNAVLPSGPDRAERLSGQHWMTGIPVEVEPAAAAHRRTPVQRAAADPV